MRSRLIVFVIASAMIACGETERAQRDASTNPPPPPPPPPADAGVVVEDAAMPDPDASEPAIDAGPVMLGPCVAPPSVPRDPFTVVQDYALPRTMGQIHMTDIERDPDNTDLYMIGVGGLYKLSDMGGTYQSVSNNRMLWLMGQNARAAFVQLEALGAGRVAVSNRDLGFSIVSTTANTVLSSTPLINAGGMTRIGDTLLVLQHTGTLVAYDITMPLRPMNVGTMMGLGNPWEVVSNGPRAYVADNTLGVVVLDVSNPRAPMIVNMVETAGGAQDIDYEDSKLYVATGGAGIEIFDTINPDLPTSIARIEFGAPVVSVSASRGYVYGTTHESVVAADVRDPAHPVPLGVNLTDQWAMNVWADGADVFVAEWEYFQHLHVDVAAPAPSVDLEREEIFFLDANPAPVSFAITNRGSADLILSGAGLTDSRFTFTVDRATVPSGAAATGTLTFVDNGAPIDTELCIATNDPDQPLQRIHLAETTMTRAAVGQAAPDFDLPLVDDDNMRYQLSAQLGHPVVLAYFATW